MVQDFEPIHSMVSLFQVYWNIRAQQWPAPAVPAPQPLVGLVPPLVALPIETNPPEMDAFRGKTLQQNPWKYLTWKWVKTVVTSRVFLEHKSSDPRNDVLVIMALEHGWNVAGLWLNPNIWMLEDGSMSIFGGRRESSLMALPYWLWPDGRTAEPVTVTCLSSSLCKLPFLFLVLFARLLLHSLHLLFMASLFLVSMGTGGDDQQIGSIVDNER